MNVTRLLKLYKQHYLKSYEKMAENEYSCWGYFDCMEVDRVENRAERGLLIDYRNGEKGWDINGGMADLWYASASASEELSGHYGQQSIGLFRYEGDEAGRETTISDREFWKDENKGIILIACMIQLKEYSDVNNIMAEIEQMISLPEYRNNNIFGIAYRTFDNFEMILFLKGNSYVAMSKLIDKIGERDDIRFKYSVCGIAQKYLDLVSEESQITDIVYNGLQLVNDAISEVWLEIVSDGKVDLNHLSAELKGGVKYARVLGYTDNIICIRDTNMWKVVRLFRGGDEGLTHKNRGFRNGIYNISTVILPAWEERGGDYRPALQSDSEEINGWCMKKIEALRRYKANFDNKNEVLFSNWLALIRVLNVLSQYENSLFSKDIFRIIFPSIKLICHKFEDILEKYNNENFMKEGYDRVLIVEKYINEVDGIIQHLIHTSQTFLTVPGYSGSLYDIPTKMLLFYMAYAYKVIVAFNDSKTNFDCFICPLLNAKPEVQEIETEEKKEVLLDIRLSQRHLYAPRAFLVILSHELYHYIGERSRSRKKRANHIIKMCVYALTYSLLYVEKDFCLDRKEFAVAIKAKEKEIQEFLIKTISDVFNGLNKEADEKVYASATLLNLMTDSCYAVLSEDKYKLDETLRGIQLQNWQKEEDLKGALSNWADFLEEVEKNRKKIVARDTIEEIVDRFIYNFQEIYADLSSIIFLKLELKYYFEAILVSEGVMLSSNFESLLVINRLAVVVYTLSNDSWGWKAQWIRLIKDKSVPYKDLIAKIQEYIVQMTSKRKRISRRVKERSEEEWRKEEIHEWPYFYLDGVWHEQINYAETCISNLKRDFSETDEKEQCVKQIRATFGLFKMQGFNGGKGYNDLFGDYDDLIKEYNNSIDQMIEEEIVKITEK